MAETPIDSKDLGIVLGGRKRGDSGRNPSPEHLATEPPFQPAALRLRSANQQRIFGRHILAKLTSYLATASTQSSYLAEKRRTKVWSCTCDVERP